MRRILPLLLLLAVLLLAALPTYARLAPAPAPAASPAHIAQVDTSHYPDVTLYVGVTGPDGKPRSGLSSRDFRLTEDGQPVTIGSFAGGSGPIATVLVIDRSGSMDEEDKLDGAKDAAQAFVDQMRPDDQTAIIAFSNQPELIQPFTSDHAALDRAIRRIRADGSTALYDSLIAGVDALKDKGGRRALLVLTDGRDLLMTGSDQQASRASLDTALETANQAGIAVQAIGLGERGGDEISGIDEQVLQRIAQDTGGEYFYTPSADQLASLYRSLSADMQQEYRLTYRSPRPFYDGTRRDIRVSVGGGAAAAGGYVERHLIDVRSDPAVGLLLLLPILGALAAPALLRRRTGPVPAAPAALAGDRPAPLGDASRTGMPVPSTGATRAAPAGIVVLPPAAAHCTSCDAPMQRPGARFCNVCGAAQQAPPMPARRIFCDQCGRPLSAGADFCAHCGARAVVQVS